jgi:hypothetical protein
MHQEKIVLLLAYIIQALSLAESHDLLEDRHTDFMGLNQNRGFGQNYLKSMIIHLPFT